MKQTLFLISFLIVLAIGCTNNDKPGTAEITPTTDSVVSGEADTTFSGDNMTVFNGTPFYQYAKNHLPHFDWSHFVMTTSWKEDSLHPRSFRGDAAFYNAYGRFLKYSPDSTMFLDMDSYNLDIQKDKQGRWVGSSTGPDTEISLVDTKTRRRQRLLFLGPGSSVQDGFWLNKDDIILLGVLETGTNKGKSVSLWRFHLPTHTFYLYELPDTAAASQLKSYWKKERFRDVVLP